MPEAGLRPSDQGGAQERKGVQYPRTFYSILKFFVLDVPFR